MTSVPRCEGRDPDKACEVCGAEAESLCLPARALARAAFDKLSRPALDQPLRKDRRMPGNGEDDGPA